MMNRLEDLLRQHKRLTTSELVRLSSDLTRDQFASQFSALIREAKIHIVDAQYQRAPFQHIWELTDGAGARSSSAATTG